MLNRKIAFRMYLILLDKLINGRLELGEPMVIRLDGYTFRIMIQEKPKLELIKEDEN